MTHLVVEKQGWEFILIFPSALGSAMEFELLPALGSSQQNAWTHRKLCSGLSKVLWTHISDGINTAGFKVQHKSQSSLWQGTDLA